MTHKNHGPLTLLVTALTFATASAGTLDWSDWDSSWNAGSLNAQSLAVDSQLTITYSGSADRGTWFLAGTPDVLIDDPPSFAFNGTGGAADHYLDIYQDGNRPGRGSRHTFAFSSTISQLSLEIWDIDANDVLDNYVDLVTITANLSSGVSVAPTSSEINDPRMVQMISSDTWSGIPFRGADDDGDSGNLRVTFDYAGISSVTIEYLNSTERTNPNSPSGGHGIGIYNFTFLPEPGVEAWMVMLMIPLLRRGHSV